MFNILNIVVIQETKDLPHYEKKLSSAVAKTGGSQPKEFFPLKKRK